VDAPHAGLPWLLAWLCSASVAEGTIVLLAVLGASFGQLRLANDRFGPVLADASFIGFIPVRDLAAARAFYAGTLGLRVLDDTPFALVLDADGTMLRVTPVPDLAARPFTIAGWKVPDIDAAVRALADRGVQFARYDGMVQDALGIWATPGGDHVAWFTDPDGNTLSLTTFAAR
jgi:catechol 2,3-dioxygenase-like lactoylglutathione lyase family enzyme